MSDLGKIFRKPYLSSKDHDLDLHLDLDDDLDHELGRITCSEAPVCLIFNKFSENLMSAKDHDPDLHLDLNLEFHHDLDLYLQDNSLF